MEKKYTVFVASPSEVKKERNLLSKVIEEINLTHGAPLGYELKLWRYEDNAYPSAQKPQDLINDIIKPYQIFIGIMWRKFGTPTPTAGSGTEEEYKIAYKAWEKKQVTDIMFYFCKKPYSLNTLEENEQVGKVLQFKNDLNGKSFIWDYNNSSDFEEKIRKHLCSLMNNKIEKARNPRRNNAEPNEVDVTLLKNIWNNLTPELQMNFMVPYNENRMKGDGGIQTRDLFSAMLTNPSPELQAIVRHIPPDALPQPIKGMIVADDYIVHEKPWLSHCIASSIKRLSKVVAPDQKLTATDVFIDIVRNGSGESVRLLRAHKIDAAKIDEILKLENLHVVEG